MKTSDQSREGGSLDYEAVGVVETTVGGRSLSELGDWIQRTFAFSEARPLLPLGYFANVLQISPTLGIAISTDGVGTKILVAQEVGRYDTVGIDCVAMNANDILCVGARPVSMVDYVAVQRAESHFLGQIAKGLHEGARQARINIPGGEIAQVKEMIQGTREGYHFDLVGTCIGTVHPQHLLVGEQVRPGDVVVGIASSGIHSNGFTLARRVLFEHGGLALGARVAELGRTLGEELLEPTAIYVPEVVEMIDAGLALRALIHITSDGLLNLLRVKDTTCGFVIEAPLEPPAIFGLIQKTGSVEMAEMFRVFNMGIGFCVVVGREDADAVLEAARRHGRRASVIGYAVRDAERRVWIPGAGLVGSGVSFRQSSDPPPR